MSQVEGREQIMAKSLSVHANEYKPTSTPVPPVVRKACVLFIIYSRQLESNIILQRDLGSTEHRLTNFPTNLQLTAEIKPCKADKDSRSL